MLDADENVEIINVDLLVLGRGHRAPMIIDSTLAIPLNVFYHSVLKT